MNKSECDTLSLESYICCGIWNPANKYLGFKETIELEKLSEWSLLIAGESDFKP